MIGKDTFLIKEGEIERYSYFVYDGMLRCWLLNHKGEEQIFWFCKEGTFSMSNISFTLQTKSAFNVTDQYQTGRSAYLRLGQLFMRLFAGLL